RRSRCAWPHAETMSGDRADSRCCSPLISNVPFEWVRGADQRIERPARAVRIVVVLRLGEAFQGSKPVFVPSTAQYQDIARLGLRRERGEASNFVAAFRRCPGGESAEQLYQAGHLRLAGLARILWQRNFRLAAILLRRVFDQRLHTIGR